MLDHFSFEIVNNIFYTFTVLYYALYYEHSIAMHSSIVILYTNATVDYVLHSIHCDVLRGVTFHKNLIFTHVIYTKNKTFFDHT